MRQISQLNGVHLVQAAAAAPCSATAGPGGHEYTDAESWADLADLSVMTFLTIAPARKYKSQAREVRGLNLGLCESTLNCIVTADEGLTRALLPTGLHEASGAQTPDRGRLEFSEKLARLWCDSKAPRAIDFNIEVCVGTSCAGKCETARKEKLERWELVQKLLGNLVAVRRTLARLVKDPEMDKKKTFSYRPWIEMPIVKLASQVTTFDDDDEQGRSPRDSATAASTCRPAQLPEALPEVAE
ncbi:unnamed protein product [Prorocentrum cordatum]|uniref:Uncharacterized protein n=1 Tax=Prorocentrum cordatum TaxID=2364126 RepID=A0ABN9VS32_9DINO|nr:unnamed protein product [Polarella glacialis]